MAKHLLHQFKTEERTSHTNKFGSWCRQPCAAHMWSGRASAGRRGRSIERGKINQSTTHGHLHGLRSVPIQPCSYWFPKYLLSRSLGLFSHLSVALLLLLQQLMAWQEDTAPECTTCVSRAIPRRFQTPHHAWSQQPGLGEAQGKGRTATWRHLRHQTMSSCQSLDPVPSTWPILVLWKLGSARGTGVILSHAGKAARNGTTALSHTSNSPQCPGFGGQLAAALLNKGGCKLKPAFQLEGQD